MPHASQRLSYSHDCGRLETHYRDSFFLHRKIKVFGLFILLFLILWLNVLNILLITDMYMNLIMVALQWFSSLMCSLWLILLCVRFSLQCFKSLGSFLYPSVVDLHARTFSKFRSR